MKTLCLLVLAAGAAWGQSAPCSGHAPINITASGTTTIVVSQGNMNIRVCQVTFASSTTVNVKFVAVKPAGNTDLTGAYQSVGTFDHNFLQDLQTGNGNSLGINISATATVGGYLTYTATQ